LSATNDAGVKRYALPGVPNPLLPADIANKAYVDSNSPNVFARVVKKVDQTKNSDTTNAPDDELVIALLANKVYFVLATLFVQSPVTPDIKMLFSVPAGATAIRNAADFTFNPSATTDATVSGGFACDGNVQFMAAVIQVIMGGTPGNFSLEWAQLVSNPGDTKVLQSSSLVVYEELP